MKPALRVLIVEDSEFDAQIMVGLLRRGGYEVESQRVENAESMRAALEVGGWQLVLADYNLPSFDAPAALEVLKQSGLDLPFVIVSGGIGEDIAVASMKAGAHDYLMKGNLHRLAPVVDRELREAANRVSQREAKRALLESELRYRLLWETCPDAVVFMDGQGVIHFANPAVCEVFGFTPEELIGKNLRLLLPDRLRSAPLAGLERYLEKGATTLSLRAVETSGQRKDGSEIPIEVSFSEMMLQGERRFVGFIRDISARKRAESELRENQEQFRVARDIQQHLFPKKAPACPGFDISGGSFPAEATGGDYFDYLRLLKGRVGVVVGDVTGHGVGPALLMAETRAYLRVLAARRENLGEILTRANHILAEDVGSERFITLFLGGINPKTRSFVYSSAGHTACYILDRRGDIKTKLKRTGMALGMKADTVYAVSQEIILDPGDLVLLLTDGIEETSAPDETLFGIERTLDVVRSNRDKSSQEIVHTLYQEARAFSHQTAQTDDITAIVIKVL